ncbi:MAG: hypothetical protein ABIW31_04105 [Novosphingobium sp.]
MLELIEANWIVVAFVVVAVLLAARLIFGRAGRQAPRSFKPDVLDEGVAPAQRNQALIDAAPAAQFPPVVIPGASAILGGIGEIIVSAAQEEVVEAAPFPPSPSPAAVPAPAAVAGDDLSRIKGLGPKLRVILEGLGVNSFSQIAAWSDDDLARIDAQLGAFAGRPARDSWVEQAKFLAAGDVAGFEAKFGKV